MPSNSGIVPVKFKTNLEDFFSNSLQLVDSMVNKNYAINMESYDPLPLPMGTRGLEVMGLIKINKIVYNRNENINDKLISVYSAMYNFGSSVILIIDSTENGIDFYLGTRHEQNIEVAKAILVKSLRGNFPGIEFEQNGLTYIHELYNKIMPESYDSYNISSVFVVPSSRDADKDRFVQGLEKFIDTMAGKSYTAVFISNPLSKEALENEQRRYELLYSALSQYAQVQISYAKNKTNSNAKTAGESFSRAVSDSISLSHSTSSTSSSGVAFFGFASNDGFGVNDGVAGSKINTSNAGWNNSFSTTISYGETENVQTTFQSKPIQELLKRIDIQLERVRQCEAYGFWQSACYFLSKEKDTALIAANTYKALVSGEKTNIEKSFINLWSSDNISKSTKVIKYLRHGLHPRFQFQPDFSIWEDESLIVTPASMVSGLELPILMGMPQKSVTGFTAVTSAEFGRNIFFRDKPKSDRVIHVGSVYHMGDISKTPVHLNIDSLTAHCFVTGTTGSGKSTAVCKLLNELLVQEVKFLIIEPAKGEYALKFGKLEGLNVYTTNPNYSNMLCINPFEFDKEIHVLEHLDRLIEVFSACWPLYAAMPAILKASFEKAYVRHGWDLNHSEWFDCGNGKYPSFNDILDILPKILETKGFSDNTKGDYIGALVTRVESLTNGITGQIFSQNGINDNILFNENTIIDISRIGSSETQALVMGILVLKLSEFRQSEQLGFNKSLRHVTVLEEAHNLLRRISSEQNMESANIQGKSVEMISRLIAEMRAYGEGFIIVDQSPTAVDISAIKNTNTKIILNLPSTTDSEVVGGSIGLNKEQMAELSQLPVATAAIFQNGWVEAVLTRINEPTKKNELNTLTKNNLDGVKHLIGTIITEIYLHSNPDVIKDKLYMKIEEVNKKGILNESIKTQLINILTEYFAENTTTTFGEMIIKLANARGLFEIFIEKLPSEDFDNTSVDQRSIYMGVIRLIRKNLDFYVIFVDKRIKHQCLIAMLKHLSNELQEKNISNKSKEKNNYKDLLNVLGIYK
jgi:hypothetical protein